MLGTSIQGIYFSFDYDCENPYYLEEKEEGICEHRFTFPLVILNGNKYTSHKSTQTLQKNINAAVIDFLNLTDKSLPLQWESFSRDIAENYALTFFSNDWVNQQFDFTVVSKTFEYLVFMPGLLPT